MTTRYIGGDGLSIGDRMTRYGRLLHAAPIARSGRWKDQCYCGSTIIVRYRGRLYCRGCGRRVPR